MTITESNGTFTFAATDTNTDTHYTNYLQIKGNGTEAVKFTQNTDKSLNLKPSGSVSISAVSGEITISATDTNTSHNHNVGIGLVGSGSAGTGGGTYTYKAKLRSETALTVDSAAATTTSGRVYPVAVDKSGYLSVNVPWTAVTETTVRNWGFTKNEGTLTDVDLFVGGPDAKEDGATTNGNTYLNLLMNSGIRSVHNIVGSGHTTVTSDASGTITINSTVPDISGLVPYDGATHDVNLVDHSLSISDKTDTSGTMIKVSGKGVSEDDVWTTIEPYGINIASPGITYAYLGSSVLTISDGAQSGSVTETGFKVTTPEGTSVYGYNGIIYKGNKLSFPEAKEGTIALTSDLSTLLDKGTSSTVVNQVVYNPVEMKKNLTVPSLSGEKTTIAGNSISTFGLGGTKDGSTAMSDLTLVGFSGTSSIDNVYTTHIQQLSTGPFQITYTHGKNLVGTLTFDGSWWRMNSYNVLTEENCKFQQWKLTSTSGTVTTVNICVKK